MRTWERELRLCELGSRRCRKRCAHAKTDDERQRGRRRRRARRPVPPGTNAAPPRPRATTRAATSARIRRQAQFLKRRLRPATPRPTTTPTTPPPTPLLGAEAAFETTEGSELDPFRVAAGVDPAPSEPKAAKAGAQKPPKGGDARKLFVGGLSHGTDEASLTKFFARFGKVQECHVARTEGGKHRGFGFVTFVSHKGSAFAVKEAGDPPEMMVDGRKCNVRYTEDRGPDLRGVNTNALPARGAGFLTKQKAPAAFGAGSSGGGGGGGGGGRRGGDDEAMPELGVAARAQALRRMPHEDGGGGGGGGGDNEAGGGKRKRGSRRRRRL